MMLKKYGITERQEQEFRTYVYWRLAGRTLMGFSRQYDGIYAELTPDDFEDIMKR